MLGRVIAADSIHRTRIHQPPNGPIGWLNSCEFSHVHSFDDVTRQDWMPPEWSVQFEFPGRAKVSEHAKPRAGELTDQSFEA